MTVASHPSLARLGRLLLAALSALLLLSAVPVRGAANPVWTVMSFNLRYAGGDSGEHSWEARRTAVVARIVADGADLVATQECLAVQAEDLQRLLPDYALAGAGRDDGDRAGEMCALLWRRDQFIKLEEGHRWHGDDPFLPGVKDADAACVRMFSWVLLAERAAPHRRLVLVDTHLDHVGVQARARAAWRLKDWITSTHPGTPLILAGDFNCAAGDDAEPWRILTAEGERPLADAFRALHPAGSLPEGTFHGFQEADQPGRIDWILATPELAPLEAWIDRERVEGRQPSDHHPVVVRFLPPPGGAQ